MTNALAPDGQAGENILNILLAAETVGGGFQVSPASRRRCSNNFLLGKSPKPKQVLGTSTA